jgi:hypothetical protein
MDVTGNKTEMVSPARAESYRRELSLGAWEKAAPRSVGISLASTQPNELSPNIQIRCRNSHMDGSKPSLEVGNVPSSQHIVCRVLECESLS